MIGSAIDPVSFLLGFVSALALAVTLTGFIALAFSHTDKRGLSQRRHTRESPWAELSRELFPKSPAVAPPRDSRPARTTAASDAPVVSLPRPNRHRSKSK